MITDLIDYWNVDVAKSLMMGDNNSDLLAASKSKLKFYYPTKNFNLIKKIINFFLIKMNLKILKIEKLTILESNSLTFLYDCFLMFLIISLFNFRYFSIAIIKFFGVFFLQIIFLVFLSTYS